MNIDNLWDNFLEQIKPKISSLSYDTWFKNTKLVSLDNNVAKILVDSPLQKKSLQETWYQTISDVFSEITNTSFDFEFVFEDEVKTNTIIPVENIGVPLNTPEKSNLNSKYTFDSFIVGESNKFAYMAEAFKKNNLNVWSYTGYEFEYILEHKDENTGWNELLNNIDVLVDGRFEIDKKNDKIKFRGSSNQRIIDVKNSLKEGKVITLDY